MFKRSILTVSAIAATTAPAFAHIDPTTHGSFVAGFTHPVFGLDHILAMVAVGLWASQIGARAMLAVPAAFLAAMAAGYAAAVGGLSLVQVEPAILASVVGLGLLVALAVRIPTAACAAVAAAFALFHGHAHGTELGAAGAMTFGLGFVLATALLHAAGILVGLKANRLAPLVIRIGGAAIALTGLSMALV